MEEHQGRKWSYLLWPVLAASGRSIGVMAQVTNVTETTLFSEQTTAINEQLMISVVRQHELTEEAERLSAELQMEINERKRMEEELRKSRDELELRVAERTAQLNRLAAAVENATEAIMITDPSWHIEYTNPAFTRYTGYTSNEVIGRGISIFRPKSVDRSVYDKHRKAAIEGRPYVDQHPILRKNGSRLAVESVLSSVKDDKGETRNYVLVWRDVSERLRLEEQLHQGQKMEAIGSLAGGIAHDFNNMLAVIIGNAELALDDLDGNGPKRNVEQIVKASKRARDLVKQILAFSRKTERGKNTLKLTRLVKETYTLLRGALPSTIRMDLDIQTESDAILADPSHMSQVLMNLATNAADSMRKKGGILTIGLSSIVIQENGPKPDAELAPGAYVKLSVRDTGTGMTDKLRDRIFDPFFTTKQTGKGTGMGLAVVYGIVKSYDGVITVDTEPGRGSEFNVFLPSVTMQVKQEREVKGAVKGGTERILLIDDEPSIIEMTSQTLERLGYRVTAASSGSEAWNMFTEEPEGFDLVITDQTMPDITGIELAKKMLARRKDLPVILITGYSDAVSAEEARASGVREFVMKPIVKREVAETIRRALSG